MTRRRSTASLLFHLPGARPPTCFWQDQGLAPRSSTDRVHLRAATSDRCVDHYTEVPDWQRDLVGDKRSIDEATLVLSCSQKVSNKTPMICLRGAPVAKPKLYWSRVLIAGKPATRANI